SQQWQSPRPRLLETLQLRSPPGRRSTNQNPPGCTQPAAKTPLLHPHMSNLLDPTPRNNNNLRRRNSDIGENGRVEENTHRWGKGEQGEKASGDFGDWL
ncbi:unnamed protein product, partial [Aureobasidium pullulans]